ncbi:MAG: YkgJ family cysteine cluster protein [Candidatus Binatus sp.]|uniref:YkgJ family cysteine cluster protein n=1 Tax=Candidatus Binatus sp. TaxID=2811406 RepID=UPI002728566A|nr:YkgJ family cysteine cluster protein [Candidatus Binatus sp.]MDO8432523.1 YkgJ family cysteine cluster protein [Candidatus Binatus sp.]
MNRNSAFSYACNACGRCCHDKVITISPYDVLRIARAMQITTGEAIARYTIRRGSILKFIDHRGCVALDGVRCGLHRGRPLACRLYPLGIERVGDGDDDRVITLEPAQGSRGVYGGIGTVDDFLASQEVAPHLEANARYRELLPKFRARIYWLTDFDRIEPREFWRVAVREALAESGYDPNPLIDAIFDPDSLGCARDNDARTVAQHLTVLSKLICDEPNPAILASAAVMLAISLGYSPSEVSRP